MRGHGRSRNLRLDGLLSCFSCRKLSDMTLRIWYSVGITILFLVFANDSVVARESRPEPRDSSRVSVALPLCRSEQSSIDSIFADVKANAKTPNKYRAYKQALVGESDENLFARLIYAETKASSCVERENEIMPIVAAVIHRRIERRGGDIQAVIFERDQFASSLNNYSESHYRDFLCPVDQKAWAQALALATVDGVKEEGVSLPKDAVHYYFYKHSSRFTPPAWAQDSNSKNEVPISKDGHLKDCIRVFRNANWR